MDELVPNPDGCRAFEPNQFKKEKCKNCNRYWYEHKGVISEALVNSYAGAKRKATEDKLQKEAEAKAKLKATAVAKKKAQQAPEDEWLFDSKEGEKAPISSGMDSDDDDAGFRMQSASDFAQTQGQAQSSGSFKPLKVKNLIDFEECDIPEDLGNLGSSSMQSIPSQEQIGPAPTKQISPLSGPSPNASSSAPPPPPNNAGMFGVEDQSGVMADLLAEMDSLKLMLQTANEEKNIQVAIVKDEVAEKQQVIEDMKIKSAAAQAELTSLRQQLNDQSKTQQQTEDADALRKQVAERDAEIERLKAAASLPLPPPAAPDPAKEEELARLRLEVEELRKPKAPEAPPPLPAAALPASLSSRLSEVYKLCIATCQVLEEESSSALPPALGDSVEQDPEGALRRLCEAATLVQTAAQRSSQDRRQLLQKLSDAEVAAKSAISAAALAATKPLPVVPEAPRRFSAPAADHPQEATSHRQAALALREVRLNAERQLAWISKRIKTSYQDGRDNAIACP